MVWIHGGGRRSGWPGMPQYDGATLAAHGVVVVTVAYRLGPEGFGGSDNGLRDRFAALAWVHRNIAAFGGDPGAVTVFGQSAGAASAVWLAAYPGAKGRSCSATATTGSRPGTSARRRRSPRRCRPRSARPGPASPPPVTPAGRATRKRRPARSAGGTSSRPT
nr:alpha/beta fold hydrolase [Catenuloplanes nepalensis]